MALLLVVVGAALLILANLDAGPVKSWVRSLARDQGIDLDFADGSVTLGGVRLHDVRVSSPAADATLAPHLVRIGTIEGRWSPLSKRIDDLVIRDVTLTVVVDPDGTTSFDRWLAGLPPSPPPPVVPLSQTLEGLIPTGIAARARLEDVKLHILRRAPEGMLPLVTVTGITAAAELAGGRADLTIGPSDVALTVGERAAVAKLDGGVKLDGRRLSSRLDLTMLKQELAPELPAVKKLLDLVAAVDFQPDAQKTAVSLERLALLDGAVQLDAAVDLHDAAGGSARPVVNKASCRIDTVAVARALPKDLGPITVEAEGPLRCTVAGLELSPPKGKVDLSGRFTRVVYQDIEVRGLGLEVEARPDGDALSATVHLPVEKVTMPDLAVGAVDVRLAARTSAATTGGFPVDVDGTIAVGQVDMPGQAVREARITVAGQARSASSFTGKLHVAVQRVAAAAELAGVDLDVDLGDVTLADPPTASTGKIKIAGKIARVVQPAGPRAGDVALDVSLALAGAAAPSSGGVTVEVARLTVPGLDDFAGKPLDLRTDLEKIVIDHQDPARSSGRARLKLAYGAATTSGTVEGSAGDLSWDLEGNADRVGPAQAVAFKSKGHYGKTIVQETSATVGRVSAKGTALKSGQLTVSSSGTMRRQEARIAAALEGLAVNGKAVGSPKLDVTVGADLDRPRVELAMKGTQPETDLKLFAEIDGKRTVTWKIDGKLARLGALAPLLPAGPDWNQLGVRVKGGGVIAGVVRSVKDGVPTLVADPATRARGKSSLELVIKDLGYKGAAETVADAAEITLRAEASFGGDKRVASLDLVVPELAAVASGVHVAVEKLTARVDAVLEKSGRADAKLAVRVGNLKQSAFAAYPVHDLAIDAQVNGDPNADLNFRAAIDNVGAGTKIELSGQTDQRLEVGLDAVPGRRSLGVDGQITQTLDALDGAPALLRARGRVSVPFRVESGDLVLFNTRGTVKLENVSVELPGSKIAVRDARGELPIFEEIVMGPEGAELVGRGERGIYPQLRFSDQQPFLGSADYLSIAELTVGDTRFGPLAGNVRLDRDVLAVDQLELNALGGKITGQTIIEVRGKDTRVAFRGKVTGVRPSSGKASGDRLDANAALTIVPYKLGLEGRVEIVEIGRAHLLDLLDLWDPYHADVSANRVRLGLKFGYPKQVRLKFLHGFASLFVELGGLAGAVRIDEIKGIPIGPALSNFLAPILEATP